MRSLVDRMRSLERFKKPAHLPSYWDLTELGAKVVESQSLIFLELGSGCLVASLVFYLSHSIVSDTSRTLSKTLGGNGMTEE